MTCKGSFDDSNLHLNLASLCIAMIQLQKLEAKICEFEAFISVLEEADPDSVEAKLRKTDLAMEKIELFVIGKIDDSVKQDIITLLIKLTHNWTDYKVLKVLTDPKTSNRISALKEHVKPAWRIIHRIPGASERLKTIYWTNATC